MKGRRAAIVGWSAFLAACALELVIFGLFDPIDLHWRGNPIELPRVAVYSVGFVLFWAAAAVSSFLTCMLMRSSDDINRGSQVVDS